MRAVSFRNLSIRSWRRYGTTVVIGAIADLSVAMALSNIAGMPLQAAAAIGFAVALGVNYLLFEFWAFDQREHVGLSTRRFAVTVLAAVIALGVRLSAVTGLGAVFARTPLLDMMRFGLSMACSFAVNYVLVCGVFARTPKDKKK